MNALIAGSLPEPTPSTTTPASFTPKAAALPPIISPTLPAANGVPFFAPLKPRLPALDQNKVLPPTSDKSTLVLLNVASICKTPEVTFFLGVFEATFTSTSGFTSSVLVSFFCILRLTFLSLAGSHGLPHITPDCSRIGLGTLAPYRQPLHVTNTSIALNIFQPLDISRDLSFEISFYRNFFHDGANAVLFFGS